MMMCVVYTMRAGVTLPMIKLSRISRDAIVGQASKRDGNGPPALAVTLLPLLGQG